MTDTLANSIQEGDLIMVCYPLSEKSNNPAHKFDGEQFVVKTKRRANTDKGGDTYLYELEGAVSSEGLPFVFLTDELIKL